MAMVLPSLAYAPPRSRRTRSTALFVVLGLSVVCIVWVVLIFRIWASPVKFEVEEAEALTTFIVRSLGDALPEPPETVKESGLIYIFGFSETDDNVHSVSAGVSRAYSDLITAGHSKSQVKVLMFDVLNDGSHQDTLERRLPNYSGSKKMLRIIRSGRTWSSAGTEHDMNIANPPEYPDDFDIHPWKHSTIHTPREAKAAVNICRSNSAKALVIVATPFHLPRCLLTTLSVATQSDPHLRVYSRPGDPLRWDETVAHSQGDLVGDRESLLESEMERMFVYHQKGDLMEPSDALEALRKRDRRSKEAILGR